jgi:hypothetical protein
MKDPELVERIAVADPGRAAILRSFPADVSDVRTPFYKRTRVVDIDVETHVGRIRYRYGLEGERCVALGETPEAVYELNEREGLTLRRDSVREYIRYFFDSVGGRKMRIVESAKEVPWRERTPGDPRPDATKPDITPVTIEALAGGYYRAVANAIWDVMLIEVTLAVSPGGRVHPTSQRLLADRLEIVPA